VSLSSSASRSAAKASGLFSVSRPRIRGWVLRLLGSTPIAGMGRALRHNPSLPGTFSQDFLTAILRACDKKHKLLLSIEGGTRA
jgi:hypothetical protein